MYPGPDFKFFRSPKQYILSLTESFRFFSPYMFLWLSSVKCSLDRWNSSFSPTPKIYFMSATWFSFIKVNSIHILLVRKLQRVPYIAYLRYILEIECKFSSPLLGISFLDSYPILYFSTTPLHENFPSSFAISQMGALGLNKIFFSHYFSLERFYPCFQDNSFSFIFIK